MYNKFDFPREEDNDIDNNENGNGKLEFLDYDEYRRIMNINFDDSEKKQLPKDFINKTDLSIYKFATNKHDIKQRPMMEEHIIPQLGASTCIIGKSGSGKSNLLMNLMCRKDFYGKENSNSKTGYFDIVFFFSPTGDTDDLVKYLSDLIPKKRIVTEDFEEKLEHIFKVQEDIIKAKTFIKSPKILIIYDDIQSNAKFMRSKIFIRSFIACRHSNITTILCGQSWTKTPRVCRLQASNIMLFPSSQSEVDLLVEEYAPPHMTKKDFYELVKHATKERYNFLHICMRVDPEQRFRKNLDTIINI